VPETVKNWEQFSRLNEGFDLSSMSEDTHSADITDGDKVDANDPKRSFCLEQTSCEQFDIASDQSPNCVGDRSSRILL